MWVAGRHRVGRELDETNSVDAKNAGCIDSAERNWVRSANRAAELRQSDVVFCSIFAAARIGLNNGGAGLHISVRDALGRSYPACLILNASSF